LGQQTGAQTGERAPDFTLKDMDGVEWRLSDQRGRIVVLLFYPGDETPVCTKQLCSVRDNWEEYAATGAEVIGISMDTVESHKSFTEHHSLPLRLLSDAGGEVSKAYGAQSWLPNRSARAVVVIDAEGIVRYRKVQPLSLFRPKDDDIITAIRAARAEPFDEKGATGAI
jgi:peroxiredoxin Q/BCP